VGYRPENAQTISDRILVIELKVGVRMWLQILRACLDADFAGAYRSTSKIQLGIKPRIPESRPTNLDFSNLGEIFDLFRRTPRESENTFVAHFSTLFRKYGLKIWS